MKFSRRDWLKTATAITLGVRSPAILGSAPQRNSRAARKLHGDLTSPKIATPLAPVNATFVDVTASAGITFRHDNAASPEKYLIETMGAGCGWIDFDQDGLLDLYLVDSAATRLYTPKQPLRGALYRNKGDGTFTDVTLRAGVGVQGLFGMGVAVGDYDNDGFPDLYVTGYDRSTLYHNNGDGTFTDVTAKAAVGNHGKWGSSAAWFDYDNDGRLDLVIANYVDWSPDHNVWCGEHKPGYRGYCHPDVYHGQTPTLYHNNGDGTFTDASATSGVGARPGNGLGVVTFDYDDDGWQDIFIANDGMENFLFHNNRDGTFREVGYIAGVAVNSDGKTEAGMGTDAADTSGDGRLDLIVTHLDFEQARYYRNQGEGAFEDATFAAKLGYATFHLSGFGTRFMDYDNDGYRDLFMANGHILDNIELFHAETHYAEPKLMFRNTGRGTFENVSDKLGPDFEAPRVSRGAAVGDFDNDGRLDILVSNNGQASQLLRNHADGAGSGSSHWLEIFLIGTKSNRDGVGARVKVTAGDLVQYDQRKGGMSYQSAQDPRLHFGLGSRTKVDSVEIRWPSGAVTGLEDLPSDRVVTVKEGVGIVPKPFPRLQTR